MIMEGLNKEEISLLSDSIDLSIQAIGGQLAKIPNEKGQRDEARKMVSDYLDLSKKLNELKPKK